MKLAILSVLGLANNAALSLGPRDNSNSNNLTVRTSTGTFTGFIDPEFPNSRQWRSIPFAEPPVGSRRWLRPKKLSSLPSEHHYATKYPPSCPQFVTAVESMWNLPLTKGNLIYNGAQNDTSGLVGEATSEDCLYLAVWAPTGPPPKGGFPVLFFMTGGGFVIGGIDLPWQIPTSWVERSQSAIIVSINYRVNIFGFPRARGLNGTQQNLGVLDQRAALEWVRDNIQAFGGNPKRIMQWGRSAGATATDIHAHAYRDDPIAQSYYLESGTAFLANPPQDPIYSNFSFVAQHVGCAEPCGSGCDDSDGKAELDCMRRVSATQISNFLGQYTDRGDQPGIFFSMIRDDLLFFRNYTARSEAGLIARRPAMISFTANELSSLVPWPKDNLEEGPAQPPITAGDIQFACGTRQSVVYRNRLGNAAPVFRWQYAGTFPNLNVYDWLGAYHNSETPLVFGTYRLLDHIADTTPFQVEVSKAIQDRIMAFAQDPYHGPQKVFGWEPQNVSDPNGGIVLRFGSKGKAVQEIDGHEIDGVCLGLGLYDPFP